LIIPPIQSAKQSQQLQTFDIFFVLYTKTSSNIPFLRQLAVFIFQNTKMRIFAHITSDILSKSR